MNKYDVIKKEVESIKPHPYKIIIFAFQRSKTAIVTPFNLNFVEVACEVKR
jgi:hypothetical protein